MQGTRGMVLSHLTEAVKMEVSGRSAGWEESATAGTVVSFIAVLGFKVYPKLANLSGIHMDEMGARCTCRAICSHSGRVAFDATCN